MITGSEYPLSEIFSASFEYHIPQYQRPYAWTEEEAGILFDDLFEFFKSEDEDNYFLGSMVLIKQEREAPSEVIDGQQRLTTLTILLAVITDALTGDMRDDCKVYLREKGNAIQGIPAKPRLILREADQPFFEEYIQSLNLNQMLQLDPAQLKSESQQRIWHNCKTLRERLQTSFQGDAQKIAQFANFLVTRCYLVVVSTPNQPSAYRVFSIMNSRGLDLLPTDIIKADLIANVPDDERDSYAKRWEELENLTTRNGFEDVFSHTRMIFAKRKPKRALNEEFKSFVIEPTLEKESNRAAAAKQLFKTVIEPMALAYITVRNSDYQASSNPDEVNKNLAWLNRINNSDWIPVAMAFTKRWGDDSSHMAWLTQKLERLAAYLLITAKSINKRIARYSMILEEMDGQLGPEDPKLLTTIELTPSEKEEFLEALGGEIYAKTSAIRRYTILRLDSFIADGAASYEPSIFTIEHVLPQTVSENSNWARNWPDQEERDYWMNRIANLVPLNRRRNSSAQNYDFERKKKQYFSGNNNVSSYALTTQVLATDEWLPEIVKQRQDNLMEVFRQNWEL